MNDVTCFDLATVQSTTGGTCSGDIIFLMGAMVDLQAGNPGGGFCVIPGSHTDLSSIPSDYSACTWEVYIEGSSGLANTGYIVRDKAGAHHFKMVIVDNTLPTITFRLSAID